MKEYTLTIKVGSKAELIPYIQMVVLPQLRDGYTSGFAADASWDVTPSV